MRRLPLSPRRVLAVFGDYSVATATTPPIPTVLYRQRHDHIEKAWRAGDQTVNAP